MSRRGILQGFQQTLENYGQVLSELEQALPSSDQVMASMTGGAIDTASVVQSLPLVISHMHDYFVHVAARLEKLHLEVGVEARAGCMSTRSSYHPIKRMTVPQFTPLPLVSLSSPPQTLTESVLPPPSGPALQGGMHGTASNAGGVLRPIRRVEASQYDGMYAAACRREGWTRCGLHTASTLWDCAWDSRSGPMATAQKVWG